MKRFFVLSLSVALFSAAAVAQNALSAYTTLEEPLAKALFEQFTKETGITVNFVRLSGGEAVARIEAEAANPQASIWVGGVGLDHITAQSKGLTTPYRSRFAQNTPAEFKDPANYWIGLYVGPLTFVTNLNRAKALGLTPPQSWADLLKPEYKGYIRMANPNISGTAYNVLTTTRTLNNGNENAAFDYLKKLDANIDQYARSGSAPGKSVATGEIPIAIGYAHDQVKLKVEGAPVEITAPSEGTGYELASMSLIRGGKDQVAARRLYDWILSSPNAQKLFTEWYLVLVSNGAQKHPLALSLNQIKTIRQDMVWDGNAVNKNRLLDRWNKEIGSKR
ncbi:MAG: ABC transporter substrate-binding protein [Spirochaetaceae bacterium]|jgi:iron(III) transport system substrate-binding protein|nr:ABC transporter substrate-binding protein [Spirochaetaceae bacterium]